MPGIHQNSYALARPRNGLINFTGVPVSSASLNVAMQEMVSDGVEHRLRGLRTRGIVEKDEVILQSRKCSPDLIDRKIYHDQK